MTESPLEKSPVATEEVSVPNEGPWGFDVAMAKSDTLDMLCIKATGRKKKDTKIDNTVSQAHVTGSQQTS